MSKIKVDREGIVDSAKKMERHVSDIRSQMKQVKGLNDDLRASWEGMDRAIFDNKYDEMVKEKTTFDNYIKIIGQHADYLRKVDEIYRKAQEDAYNKANRIPKYWD